MKYVLIGGGVLLAIGLAVAAFLFGKGTSAVPPTATPAATEETVVVETPEPEVTTVYVVITATPGPGGASVVPVTGGGWTPAVKCEWLRSNFPQTTEGVQSLGAQLANVQKERVRTHLYPCSSTVTAFDGFIILGPNEGYSGNVTMTVPPHGAIDSYVGASFSGRNTKIGENTIRALDGTVTATTMTFWPWLDEDPPLGVITPSTSGSSSCEQPADLATRMGWQNPTMVDPAYGGLQVELTSTSTLPPLWEALSSGRSIKETDTDRTMVLGVWTIYPPYSCREALGYSK